MNFFYFYNDWLDSQFASKSIGVDSGTFSSVRERFGSSSFWDFFKRKLSVATKLKLKSVLRWRTLFKYSISAEEKDFSIDFVKYICEKKPIFHDNLFLKDNYEEIKKILTAHFFAAHFDHVGWRDIFPQNDYIKFLEADRKHTKFLKKKKDYYEYNGFKTRTYGFEYGVLANRCGLDVVPSERLAMVKGGIVIDCGAFDGDSAFFFTSLTPKKILAIEPDEENFKALQENKILNSLESVTPLMVGVGQERGKVNFLGGSEGAKVFENGNLVVTIDRIDNLMKEYSQGDKAEIIKMDIEGYEKNALLGAAETIKNDKPILVIALYHAGRDFFEIPEYVKSLRPDYQMRIISVNPLTPIFEKYLIAW